MYVVTRSDMSPGFQACQATHAAFQFAVRHPELTSEWSNVSNYLVVLSVPDEDALLDLLDQVCDLGLIYEAFVEPDLNNEHTAVAIYPSEATSRLLANLPLALREEAFA
jgi:peptidyl-tRNA hydrolase